MTKKNIVMQDITQITTKLNSAKQNIIDHSQRDEAIAPVAGLPIRTDICAGLAWDDVGDKAQELWGNLSGAVRSLTSSSGVSS